MCFFLLMRKRMGEDGRTVTSDLRSIRPAPTKRIALGYCRKAAQQVRRWKGDLQRRSRGDVPGCSTCTGTGGRSRTHSGAGETQKPRVSGWTSLDGRAEKTNHEGHLLNLLSNPDYKAFPAKLETEDGRPDRALDTCALERDLEVHPGGLLDRARGGDVIHAALDQDRLD